VARAVANVPPELVHQLSQRVVRVAEPIRDFLLRTLLHKNGPQCFVLSVIRLGGLRKELPATAVIHDQTSLEKMSVGCWAQTKGNPTVKF
jgi:hypothetical protein